MCASERGTHSGVWECGSAQENAVCAASSCKELSEREREIEREEGEREERERERPRGWPRAQGERESAEWNGKRGGKR